MTNDPEVLDSARKHGVHDIDSLHAYRNPVRAFVLDDRIMLIGSSPSGQLLEIGLVQVTGVDLIVHAMPARQRFVE